MNSGLYLYMHNVILVTLTHVKATGQDAEKFVESFIAPQFCDKANMIDLLSLYCAKYSLVRED